MLFINRIQLMLFEVILKILVHRCCVVNVNITNKIHVVYKQTTSASITAVCQNMPPDFFPLGRIDLNYAESTQIYFFR